MGYREDSIQANPTFTTCTQCSTFWVADETDWFRPKPVSKFICVIDVAIGAHQHRKHMVSSAWSVAISLVSILLIV